MTAPAIAVEGLTKSFGDKTVVDHFDITVPEGKIYGFVGPNGSGKTTTIRLICGLLKPDAGHGTCLGFDILTESARIKERVGYMTQNFSLYGDLTVRENLQFLARLYHVPQAGKAVARALDEYQLTPRARQLSAQLSGGWKQRLALAAASIHRPRLLLLDEPTAGVDPEARHEFWERIRQLASGGVTVLVSTHYMDEAEQCDRVAFIAYGKKLIDAPTVDITATVGLVTWRVEGPELDALQRELAATPGIDQVTRYGATLSVSGTDEAAFRTAIAPFRERAGYRWSASETGLEEAFIYLMRGAENNYQ